MSIPLSSWIPAALLSLGTLATLGGGIREQVSVPLQASLESVVPTEFLGFTSDDVEISAEEQAIAGMDHYVMRIYSGPDPDDLASAFSVYVGYYEHQTQGHTIHSPKNCLPGGGWEPLTSSEEQLMTGQGPVPVNRYLIGNGPAQAVVLYWYQGRGRVQANEYAVKWALLRDRALKGRSDEALVRVIVPVTTTQEEAYSRAVRIASDLVGQVDSALPA